MRAQDAHVERKTIAQRASLGNTLEARVEVTKLALRLPAFSPQQRPPCFSVVAAKSWHAVRRVHQDFVQIRKIAGGLC